MFYSVDNLQSVCDTLTTYQNANSGKERARIKSRVRRDMADFKTCMPEEKENYFSYLSRFKKTNEAIIKNNARIASEWLRDNQDELKALGLDRRIK